MTARLLVAVYLGAIVAANLILDATDGRSAAYTAFLFIGLDLASRDRLHDLWREHLLRNMALLIAAGSALSFALGLALGEGASVGRIALASAAAFAVAFAADTAVYHWLRERPWLERSNRSNVVGAALDSLVFVALWPFGWDWDAAFGLFCAKAAGGVVWSLLLARSPGEEWSERNHALWGDR